MYLDEFADCVGTQGDTTYVSQTGSRGFNATSFGSAVATSVRGLDLELHTQTLYMPDTYEYQNSGALAPDNVNPGAYYYSKHKSDQANSGYNSYFGRSVSLNGKYALVGAPGYNYKDGAAFVYKLNNITSTWAYFQMLTCESPLASAAMKYTCPKGSFGFSVAISDNNKWFVVGAPNLYKVGNSDPAGGVFGYAWNATYNQWSVSGTAMPINNNGQFGYSVAVSGNYGVAGSPFYPSFVVIGGMTIIQKTKSSFVQTMSTQGIQPIDYSYFGFAVGIGSGFAAVGSSCNKGMYPDGPQKQEQKCVEAVYMFSFGCGYAAATPCQTILPVATSAVPNIANMTFGYSVSLNANMMLIGAPAANDGKGAVFIYELWGTTWTQTNVLSSTVQGEYGYALHTAASGGSAMISAPGQSSGSPTVGPGQVYFYQLLSSMSVSPTAAPI
eukprot:gene27558-34296_t